MPRFCFPVHVSPLSLLVTFLLIATATLFSTQDDAVDGLKSKDAEVRLASAKVIAEAGGEDAEKHLLKLLKDDDWEVVMVALQGLGKVGGKKSLNPIAKLAIEGPIRAIRFTAADAHAQLDGEEALEAFSKKLSKETLVAACEALVRVGRVYKASETSKSLKKLLTHKELPVRIAAARALVSVEGSGRKELVAELLKWENVGVRAAALEAMRDLPESAEIEVLSEFCARPDLKDVETRRALLALASSINVLDSNPGEAFVGIVGELCKASEAHVARRGCALARHAASFEWGKKLDLVAATAAARGHADESVRAGAGQLLGTLDAHSSLEPALALYDRDAKGRVRLAALGAVLALRPVTTDETRTWLVEKLNAEGDRDLREAIAVALGDKELANKSDAVKALIDALADKDWGVAACAAVSLGMTRSESATAPLAGLTKSSGDWRLRGAAVVGLSKCLQLGAIDALIQALADEEPLVVRTAHTYLLSIARGDQVPPEVKAWTEWWKANGANVRLYDPKEREERRKKYGYAAPPQEVYEGLDILVLESRGDHIQYLLDQLGIEHRMTSSSKVQESGLDAAGVFVANCTGEMEPVDLARVEWFVKVGGYLCGSCWALSETIARIAPGIVRKLETRDEIVDSVIATACDPDSQYLEGVFAEFVEPLYRLEGAHIIEVLQPERVEMLVDSIVCAERWGGGNLACWFKSGHGTILDSANHFDLQGLAEATGLKKREERMAYAADHMGTSFAELRETAKEKFWDSNQKAAERIRDYSVFRLVTNFVRLRRIEGR